MDIPAVGLESEEPLEVRQGIAVWGGGDRCDVVWHESILPETCAQLPASSAGWQSAKMPCTIEIMPKARGARNRLVAALLHEKVASFELGIVADIFGLPRPEMGPDWYRFITVAEEQRPLRATGGMQVCPEGGLEVLARAGTIVIPGWRTDGALPTPAVKRALSDAYDRGTRLVSICSGAFLLAACGLLAGRRATTHWLYTEQLRTLYPDVEVNPDVLYVDEDQILTSAGSAAGVDLMLHIVRKDFGARAANEVARRMVMAPHREGGQAQFIDRPVPTRTSHGLGPLLEAIQRRPADSWTIARMARRVAMSQRTFIRRFQESTGMGPGEWVIAARLEAARFLLESSAADLDEISRSSGFGSPAALRHHFRRQVGLTPTAYRAQFGAPR
ncbi:MAG TPA: transcriptional regulator FtrA [Steroidobacteraceae bacterium]|nr:transcriptional regulator FtrA [Steroidobacteraceae bacterium]